MSDAEAEVEEGDDAAAADDDELPEMESDEFADADLDALAEEIEEEAGADTPDVDSEGGEIEDDTDADEHTEGDLSPGGESWGDMYVGTLTTVSNALIDEHGTEGAEQVDEDLARQLHLDEYFDEWMDSRGKSDMPPEQALLISTTMFLAVVVGTKTELPSKLLQEVDY